MTRRQSPPWFRAALAGLTIVAGACGSDPHPSTTTPGTGGTTAPPGTGGVTGTPARTLSFRTASYDGSLDHDLDAVAVADLNGDGHLDVVGAALGNGGAVVFLSDGQGGWLSSRTYLAGRPATTIAAGDLDGDGDVDLALGWNDLNGAAATTLLYNDGTGVFAAPSGIAPAVEPSALAIGDLDGDGAPDLVVTTGAGQVYVYLGDGRNGLASPVSYTLPGGVQGVVLADLDGNGTEDIAIACNQQPPQVGVLLTSRDGSLAPPVLFSAPTDRQAWSIAAADVDGDGRVDLLLGTTTGTSDTVASAAHVQAFSNMGDGTFAASASYAVGQFVNSLAAGDLDGDGDMDVVAADRYGDQRVDLLFNDGHGAFTAPSSSFGAGPAPSSVALGDLDGDGKPEVIAASLGLALLRNGGGGAFVAAPFIGGGAFVASGDVDGDGRADLVAADYQKGDVILAGVGDGTFRSLPGNASDYVGGMALADLDGDGDLDQIAIQYQPQRVVEGDELFPAKNIGLLLRLNDGHGAFGRSQPLLVDSAVQFVVSADFDGDGSADLAAATYDNSTSHLLILLNDGHGTFPGGPADYPIAGVVSGLAAGDLNGDRRADLAVTASDRGAVNIYVATTSGFAAPVSYVTGSGASGVAVADLDGDGKLDVAASNSTDASVSVLAGRGDGTLAAAAAFPFPSPGLVTTSDLDGDGRPDLIVAGQQSLGVLLNAGARTFQPARTFDGCGLATSIVASDVNGDGRPDLVAGHRAGGLCLLLNTSQ